MSDPPQDETSESDVDHGLETVDAFFLVAHEPAPAGHPSEGSFDHPATGQHLEALGGVGPLYDLDGKIEEGGLIHKLGAIVGALAIQVLPPGPLSAHRVEDHLRAGAVRDVSGREVDHQKTAIGIHRNMALTAADLLASVVSTCSASGALTDWLSTTPPVGLASRPARSRSTIKLTSWIVWNM